MRLLSPELRAALRGHVRHVHLPDRPPLYAPRALPGHIRDHLERLIREQRVAAAQHISYGRIQGSGPDDGGSNGSSGLVAEMRSWLQSAPPPPVVLSFTRRPTYVLPKHHLASKEPWELDYISSALEADIEMAFPKPPGWSSLPWRPSWEADLAENELHHNPLRRTWRPGVMIMPCAEPMFFGPGQLTIWPIMDVSDTLQRKKTFGTKYEFERILEETTVKVLKREYGIKAFSVPGMRGVWVRSHIPPREISPDATYASDDGLENAMTNEDIRRIATIHTDFVDNITRFGVSIHVGSPQPSADAAATQNNPWAALRQHNQTTSIAAELAHTGSAPLPTDAEQELLERYERKSGYLHTHFSRDGPFHEAGLKTMPYSSVVVQPGLRKSAPLGLDNRDLSTSWTCKLSSALVLERHCLEINARNACLSQNLLANPIADEFARQIGLHDGLVDHFSMTQFDSTNHNSEFPTKGRRIGFRSRRVAAKDDAILEPYDEVPVPEIRLLEDEVVTKDIIDDTRRIEAKDGRIDPSQQAPLAVSWPLYLRNLTHTLNESIRASTQDTRYLDFAWQREKRARMDRRKLMLNEANTLSEKWQDAPSRRSRQDRLKAGIIGNVLERVREMEGIVSSLNKGLSQSQVSGDAPQGLQEASQERPPTTVGEEKTQATTSSKQSELASKVEALAQLTKASLEEAARLATGPKSFAAGIPGLGTRGPLAPGARSVQRFEFSKTRQELHVERGRAKAAMVQPQPAFLMARQPPREFTPTLRSIVEEREARRMKARSRNAHHHTVL